MLLGSFCSLCIFFKLLEFFFQFLDSLLKSGADVLQRFDLFTKNLMLTETKENRLKLVLSTSKRVFPYYQGESTIFDKRNFLYHTPDSNKLINLRGNTLAKGKSMYNERHTKTRRNYNLTSELFNHFPHHL